MDSVDLEVLRKSTEWLAAGRRVLLVTVVKTWGSSPRPPGALLAVRDDGHVVGSVSGGCIEDDIVERSRREGAYVKRPQAVTYGVSAEDARKFGLPCGGTIQLVLEPLAPQSRIGELLDLVQQGNLVARTLDLESAEVALGPARAADGLAFDGQVLTTVHGPRYRMLVIGAGQLSKYLAQIAVGLDYQVTVCDPREEYDLTPEQIAHLHGPIGLYIGSRTPPEIAISILAEITATKNGVALPDVAQVAVAKEKLGPSVACATTDA